MSTIITMPTRPTPISEIELCAWVAQAAPGEALEYHRGFLGLDRSVMGRLMSYENRVKLGRASDRAWLLAEQGLAGYDINSWVALMAPGATPRPIIERLNAEANKALQQPEVQAALAQQGMETPALSPQALSDYIQNEVRKLAPILKNTKIKATN